MKIELKGFMATKYQMLFSLMTFASSEEYKKTELQFRTCDDVCRQREGSDAYLECYYPQCLVPWNKALNLGTYGLPKQYWPLVNAVHIPDEDLTVVLPQLERVRGYPIKAQFSIRQ